MRNSCLYGKGRLKIFLDQLPSGFCQQAVREFPSILMEPVYKEPNVWDVQSFFWTNPTTNRSAYKIIRTLREGVPSKDKFKDLPFKQALLLSVILQSKNLNLFKSQHASKVFRELPEELQKYAIENNLVCFLPMRCGIL